MRSEKLVLPEPMRELTEKEWEDLGFTREQFEERWQARLERDQFSPKVGKRAPDFELELLSSKGKRTSMSPHSIVNICLVFWPPEAFPQNSPVP